MAALSPAALTTLDSGGGEGSISVPTLLVGWVWLSWTVEEMLNRRVTMRTLNVVCGVSVLLMALHFTHIMHHVLADRPMHSPLFWLGMVFATIVWGLSFVGGCLLLKRAG